MTTTAPAPLPLDPGNPFAVPSDLPYGLPPFDRIREEHLAPALEAGLAEQRAEWESIATDPAPATFTTTLEALERSGALLARVTAVVNALSSAHGTEGVRAVDARFAPLLAAHGDALHLDARVFARVDAVHSARHDSGLDAEQVRLVERYHRDFVRAGAALDETSKERLRQINTELSTLSQRFSTLVTDASNEAAVHVLDEHRLRGLGDGAKAAASAAAAERGLDGWLLTLVLPTPQPVLVDLQDRDLRRELHEAAVGRGLGRDGTVDTRPVLVRMAALRAERAALFGHATHADYVLDDQTAGSLPAVLDVLAGMCPTAAANARAEAAELEELLHADGHEGPLQPWDHAYYAERLRSARFAVDAAELRPYLRLDRVVVDGVLHAAGRLYGLSFTERPDLPTYHPDVQTFEVHDVDGRGIGLFVADWFARPTKRGGAWMTTFVDQSHLLGHRPVVTVCLNVPRPGAGAPAHLTADEVDTAFHEFGHALHGLFSDVTYPRFSGTSVPRDFVEFPSQVNELWAWHPEVLPRYAVHEGEPLPAERVARLKDALGYGEGFRTTEYLAATVLDLAWHSLPAGREVAAEDVEAFEAEALRRHGLDVASVPTRYRSGYFAHVFGGSYSAGYYGYIWSEVLDAELVDWFTENGGLVRDLGDRFRAELLSRGGAVDPMAAFEAVRGRAPRPEPLLRRRGLLPAA
ncbi:M3 family metallopeptidase [Aquipuribacter nitratireducens]|uniref:M3 family metallopeptidase n=1 Tax=Aquipuribacter nitratireducens TaxID=650104 RepID=A0ABW0GJY1_9MICO